MLSAISCRCHLTKLLGMAVLGEADGETRSWDYQNGIICVVVSDVFSVCLPVVQIDSG